MNGPLQGIRVIDMGIVGTGPKTALILAWLGADVIKVESPRFPDPFRFAQMFPAGSNGANEPWNLAVGANANNRHKRSVCVDYQRPEGRAVLDRLIQHADVLLHNFRLSVADKSGLTPERVRELNPRIVFIALSSQGDSGPRRNYGSYGATLEGLGGIAGLLGTPDQPLITSVNFPDQACPLLASGTIVSAIADRDRTGRGAFIDFAQVEATALLSGDVLLATQLAEHSDPLSALPHDEPTGVFPCAGDDEWIAVEVTGDQAWAALAGAIGADVAAFAGAPARVEHREALHSLLTAWTASRPPLVAESALRDAGVAAARVLRGPEVLDHPVLARRRYFEDIDSPRLGLRRYNGNPLGRDFEPGAWEPRPAARMGEHNREVLVEAGYTHAEIDHLEELRVLDDRLQAGPE